MTDFVPIGWGRWGLGELVTGAPSANLFTTPVDAFVGLVGVIALCGGNGWSMALLGDGTVWTGGTNGNGELGDGSADDGTEYDSPIQVVGVGGSGFLTGIIAIAAGTATAYALKSDGTVYAWGQGNHGERGDGTTTHSQLTPVQVSGITTAVALAAGGSHALAALADGTVVAWGDNTAGQLGDGTTTQRTSPVAVGVLTADVVQVAASDLHSLARKSDGTVWAWGDNLSGEIGDGTTTQRLSPVQVVGVGGSGFLTTAASIHASAGGGSSYALLTDGTVAAWGDNGSTVLGCLGVGDFTNRSSPTLMVGVGGSGTLSNITQVAVGNGFVLMLPDPTLNLPNGWYGAGDNQYSQLGLPSNGLAQPANRYPSPVASGAGYGGTEGANALGGGWRQAFALVVPQMVSGYPLLFG